MVERKDEPRVNEEERARRQDAIDYARASVELEGFNLPADDLEMAQRYVNGEISLAEFLKLNRPMR